MNPTNRTLLRMLCAIACALSAIDSVQAQDPTPSPTPPAYSVLDLGTLYGGGSGATAINNSGDVVGYSGSADNTGNRGFLYSGGSMVDVGTLNGNNTAAYGVNSFADVVGQSANADNTADHAFLYSGGSISDLGTLGGTSSNAFGINDSGQIVGISDTSGDAASHAFVYSGGSMTDLGAQIGGTQSSLTPLTALAMSRGGGRTTVRSKHLSTRMAIGWISALSAAAPALDMPSMTQGK